MVSVYKTNIDDRNILDLIKPYLDNILQDASWTVDIEDCDHVMRLDCNDNQLKPTLYLLHQMGIECTEL